jgi:hypothetical protein
LSYYQASTEYGTQSSVVERTSPAAEPDDDDAVIDITGSIADTTPLADSVVNTTSTVELLSIAEDLAITAPAVKSVVITISISSPDFRPFSCEKFHID